VPLVERKVEIVRDGRVVRTFSVSVWVRRAQG
jgi:hypothetical protein